MAGVHGHTGSGILGGNLGAGVRRQITKVILMDDDSFEQAMGEDGHTAYIKKFIELQKKGHEMKRKQKHCPHPGKYSCHCGFSQQTNDAIFGSIIRTGYGLHELKFLARIISDYTAEDDGHS